MRGEGGANTPLFSLKASANYLSMTRKKEI